MMSTDRPTKEINIGEHVVKMYTYATGREFNEIQAELMKDIKVGMGGGGAPKMEGFTPVAVQDATKKTIALLVISLDGDASNVAERVLDLPQSEYAAITDALDEVSGKKKSE